MSKIFVFDYSADVSFSRQTIYPILFHHPFYVPNINSGLFKSGWEGYPFLNVYVFLSGVIAYEWKDCFF